MKKDISESRVRLLGKNRGDRYDEILARTIQEYQNCKDKKRKKDLLDYIHVVERNKYAERKEHGWW
jgi:hypothetical protein